MRIELGLLVESLLQLLQVLEVLLHHLVHHHHRLLLLLGLERVLHLVQVDLVATAD